MEAKSFFIVSLIVIAVVALVTSLISIDLLQKPVLPAYGTGREGQVQISGLEAGITNVIIVDETVIGKADISDIVTFSNVIRGNWYETAVPTTPEPVVKPFLIMNEGSDPANVDINTTGTKLFTSVDSQLLFYIQSVPVMGALGGYAEAAGYSCFDPVTGAPLCFTSVPYGSSATAGVLPFGPKVRAINALKQESTNDEAILHIKIFPAISESTGTKQTTVLVYGYKA